METLLIRVLPGRDDEVEWAITGSSLHPGDETSQSSLEQIAELAQQRRVVLIVPTEDVLFTAANLPIRNKQQLAQAVPYALEEALAQDIEDLHFSLGPRQDGDNHPVAVVSHARMKHWLKQVQNHNIQPRRIIPDLFFLPQHADTVTVLLEADRALCRTGRYSGFATDADTVQHLLPGVIEAMESPPHSIEVLRCGSNNTQLFTEPPDLEVSEGSLCFEHIISSIPDEKHSLNLLQGSYQSRDSMSRVLWPWRIAAALLTAWLVVLTITGYIDYRQLAQEDEMLTAAINAEFKKALPNITRIVKPRVQMEQQLKALRGDAGASGVAGFLSLLDAGGKAVKAVPGVDIDDLRFRDNRLEISLSTKDLQSLDGIRDKLSKDGMNAKIESADTRGDKVTARLRLQGGPS